MKIIRKLFLSVLTVLSIWGAIFTYNRFTDGFSMHQIHSSLPYNPDFDIAPLPLPEKERILNLLNQPFHYIGKGCQFYAFESEDGRWVLKFLKQKHLRSFQWLKKIPAPKKLKAHFDEKISRRQKRVENLFSSCKLAFEEMPLETGLIFIHLNRTPAFEKKITLVDKLGLKHTLFLDEHEFLLQKKAISVQKMFEKITSTEIPQKVKELAQLVKSRCQKGIADRDRSFVQNVAFCEGEPSTMFVDVGQFYKNPDILSEVELQKDVQKRLSNLLFWTQERFPNLAPIIQNTICEICP